MLRKVKKMGRTTEDFQAWDPTTQMNTAMNCGIQGLDTVSYSAHVTGFIAIAVKPWRGGGPLGTDISEVGLTYIPAETPGDLSDMPQSLKDLAEEYGLESWSIRINGRYSRLSSGHRRDPEYATVEECDVDDVQACIIRIIVGIVVASRVERLPVLVGWGIHDPLRFLMIQCPAIMPYLSSWTDLQVIFHDNSNSRDSYILPSLKDTVVSFGHDFNERVVNKLLSRKQSAASSAVWTGVMLLWLLALPDDANVIAPEKKKFNLSGLAVATKWLENCPVFCWVQRQLQLKREEEACKKEKRFGKQVNQVEKLVRAGVFTPSEAHRWQLMDVHHIFHD